MLLIQYGIDACGGVFLYLGKRALDATLVLAHAGKRPLGLVMAVGMVAFAYGDVAQLAEAIALSVAKLGGIARSQ